MSDILTKLPEIKSTNLELVEKAKAVIVVENEEQQEAAGVMIRELDRRLEWWNALIDPAVSAAYAAHKEMCKVKKEVATPLEEAKNKIGNAMAQFSYKQEQLAAEAERKLQDEMRKQQEETLLAQAEQHEKSGDRDLATAILETPVHTPVMSIPRQKVEGVTFRTTYSAEVVDLKMLLSAIVNGTVPLSAIQANTVFLNKQASALKHELKYPGVKVVERRAAAVR